MKDKGPSMRAKKIRAKAIKAWWKLVNWDVIR